MSQSFVVHKGQVEHEEATSNLSLELLQSFEHDTILDFCLKFQTHAKLLTATSVCLFNYLTLLEKVSQHIAQRNLLKPSHMVKLTSLELLLKEASVQYDWTTEYIRFMVLTAVESVYGEKR